VQVHLAGVETLRSEKDLLALFSARQYRMLGQLKQKMAAASVSGSQAKEVWQQSHCQPPLHASNTPIVLVSVAHPLR